jgi:predicted ribosomally synthesized peptide with SipW-like signal peptide
MKRRFIVIITASLMCLLAVGGTIAWLTASASLANTFTVGKIAISLTEPHWTQDSKLYPGAVIGKDPTISVTANSEDCYVYAMVDNQLNGTVSNAVTLNIHTDWTAIRTSGTKTVYRYKAVVPLSNANTTLTPVFTSVSISETTVKEANISSLNGAKIEIKAYAHQANATTQADVDSAALAYFGL